MSSPVETVEAAVREIETLRLFLSKKKTAQVRSDDERSIASATGQTWFNTRRGILLSALGPSAIAEIDEDYRSLISLTMHDSSRARYILVIKNIKSKLAQIRADRDLLIPRLTSAAESPPSFHVLTTDTAMQAILNGRWQECQRCLAAQAPLAAVVMMGGLLEGLLLAKVNQLVDKKPVFTAPSAPKDDKGNPRKLQEWMLKNFIDVAHDLKWITRSTKDIGEVLRDYRNYIHPQKEYTHKISLSSHDANLFWQISKEIIKQIT